MRLALPLGLSLGFQADALSVFMAMTSSLVACVILIYSFGYIKDYDNQNEYYFMAVLFIGAKGWGLCSRPAPDPAVCLGRSARSLAGGSSASIVRS